jgi:hypothetical protein
MAVEMTIWAIRKLQGELEMANFPMKADCPIANEKYLCNEKQLYMEALCLGTKNGYLI